jgi:thiol:disulfide interchange protein DsbC
MRHSLLSAALGLSVLITLSVPALAAGPAPLGQLIIDNLSQAQPGIPIDRVEKTSMAGVLALVLSDGTVLYGSEDGKHLFSGDMFSITDGQIVNLAEQRRTNARQELMNDPLFNDALVFAAIGEKKAAINVFTDVDCGYCRKLHQEVPQLNAMGIEVRYLAYPRAGIGSDSYKKIVSAWCSDNPQQALTKLKSGQNIANQQCSDNTVADQYNLGQKMGISGTPAIILEDGRLLPGYMPAAELAATLGL